LYTTVSIRVVIQGYLPLLTRPEHIVHFFRDVHGVYPLTKEALAKRTQEYQQGVDAFARNQRIPNRAQRQGETSGRDRMPRRRHDAMAFPASAA
jgi:hypothetical protein